MRTNPRQTWLVPLLAVPLSHVALSPSCRRDVLAWCAPNHDLNQLHADAVIIAALAQTVAVSNGTRGLTDEEAWLLLRFNYDYIGLARAGLRPAPFLLLGMDLPPDLPVGPLQRLASDWVASQALPVPLAVFICARALRMTKHRPMFIPKIDGYYAQLTRAIDHRLGDEGVTTWEDAITLTHRYWVEAAGADLAVWQSYAFHKFETADIHKTEHELAAEAHDRQRQLHRAERNAFSRWPPRCKTRFADSGHCERK